MTTLLSPPCATVVTRLFAEADASEARLREQSNLVADKKDYHALYTSLKDYYLAVSRETATLLYMLARSSRAAAIVEFGTSFGISALHLAAALRDNGGGRLIGTEFEPAKLAQARANLALAGLDDLVTIRAGDALETLAADLPETIDLVLLDGAKILYPRVLALLEPRLRPGALVVADNADQCPDYLARVRDSGSGYVSVPLAGDVELSVRV
ncbi:MAG TPA: class I SAM-dependent methyltransferase [Steroidobacteraceae bacterium]